MLGPSFLSRCARAVVAHFSRTSRATEPIGRAVPRTSGRARRCATLSLVFVDWYFDPTVPAAPLFLLACWLEHRALERQRRAGRPVLGYERRDTIASLMMGLVSVAFVGLIVHGQFLLARWLWTYRLTDLGEGPLGWAVAMLSWDFVYYWVHRVEHERRLFWAAHVNHHSSERYNLSTALRQPWTPFLTLAMVPPIALLGVRPGMIVAAGGFNLLYQFWVHTEAVDRMPRWFEWVFNTPSHHRVHHGSNEGYLDCNYAGILIVWDRLFRTFVEEREPVVYGLTKNLRSYNLLAIAFHEYASIARDLRAATTWSERWHRLFSRPGWAPPNA
jgi:sterol desaturase/sphingolipid hydroxylase (fatty acid hydroxylase superfamily)